VAVGRDRRRNLRRAGAGAGAGLPYGVARAEERVYAAATTAAAGAWLAAATAHGSSRPPLPALLLLGTLAAGVPWWTHRRRRARVRVDRTIQDSIAGPVDRFLSEELTGRALTSNLRRVADAHHRAALAAHDTTGEIDRLRRAIAEADEKINRYRATLDAGGDPALLAEWITETTAVRKAAQARLGLTEAPPQRMTDDQLDAIADAFAGLLALLRGANPRDRAELYSRIGLRMIYRPGPETVIVEVVTPAINGVF
jgi:hypothetical protein